jgi:hypothetical protein
MSSPVQELQISTPDIEEVSISISANSSSEGNLQGRKVQTLDCPFPLGIIGSITAIALFGSTGGYFLYAASALDFSLGMKISCITGGTILSGAAIVSSWFIVKPYLPKC